MAHVGARRPLAALAATPSETYERENPKRVYYLSMEFLIGRSLANNIINLLLSPSWQQVVADDKGLDWPALLEEEPDAGLGNGGLGRLAACFIDSMATMQIPAMGYGLRYEYGIFRQTIRDGWQLEQPDNWLRRPDPWEVARPQERSRSSSAARSRCAAASSARSPAGRRACSAFPTIARWSAMAARPSTRSGSGPPAAPDSFDFQAFSAGEFVGALAEPLAAESLTRVLYPDDSTSMGQGLRFVQEYFLVACSLADLVRRFRRTNADWSALAGQGGDPAQRHASGLAVPELMRILLDEAEFGWDEAWDLTQRTLAYTNHTLLPEALEKWPLRVVRAAAAAPSRDHS